MSDVLGVFGGLIKLVSDLLKFWTDHKGRLGRSSKLPVASPEAVAERFVRLFEAHGVRRSQIPLFFGHGLTLSSLMDDKTLLSALTDEVLHDAAALFGIHQEWLYGATDQVYETHDFYKHPELFSKFIISLIGRVGAEALECHALTADYQSCPHDNALILLAERVGYVVERPIYRYHLCNNWHFSYWKSHVDMYACLAIAYQREVYPMGRVVQAAWLECHVHGLSLFEYRDPDGVDIPEVGRWWPDQVIDDPIRFLEGIDGEERGRGHVLAIERWLTYCDDDRFAIYDSEFGPKARIAFEQRVAAIA
ncbi:MAG: hypothetical protein V4729_11650 [Pseudomonadota bacterium]